MATYRFGDNQGYTVTPAGGGAFTTTGAEPDELTYRGGIGFNAAPTDRVSVQLDYEFKGRRDYQSHGGSLNMRWQF